MKQLNSLEKAKCTGCTACMASCPMEAISMKADEDGFLYPQIDENLCINCKRCVKIRLCPEGNAVGTIRKRKPVNAFALKHKDVRIHRTSQSGGVFYALAQKVIQQGGVVFGAAFEEDYKVVHKVIEEEPKLYQLQGSKYVQSDMKDTILRIKQILKNNKTVLFCGTPCQCAGVASACEDNMNRLILVDLICHGVPTPKLWSDFLKEIERKHNGKVTNAIFRIMDGSKKGHVERITVDGRDYDSILYGQLFYSHAFNRYSCDHCSYKNFNRVGDLTIGDWIYGQNCSSEFWDRTGVSQVLVNTEKGEKWLGEIMDSFESLPLKRVECMQPPLERDYEYPTNKQEIQKLYREKGFRIIAQKYGHEDKMLRIKRIVKRVTKKLK